MATIICNQCGTENPEGAVTCAACDNDLVDNTCIDDSKASVLCDNKNNLSTLLQELKEKEYYAICTQSNCKVKVESSNTKHFFCTGCQIEHEIDNFIWLIEENEISSTSIQQTPHIEKDIMILEDICSGTQIKVDKEGGILGRYGKFGADFFQEKGMLMVSGEHCRLGFELGGWVIRHISRTNDTKLNGLKMNSNEPYILSDGDEINLANIITFKVRIL